MKSLNSKKILIVGDSFAADWSEKLGTMGWPNLLKQNFLVTNLAQAGCGQYKIYKQLQSVNRDRFDSIIIWHTSPFRIHVLEHAVHHSDILHSHADLIYQDIEHHVKHNPALDPIKIWFDQYYDLEYAEFVYALICDRIFEELKTFEGSVVNFVCQPNCYNKISSQPLFWNFYSLFSKQQSSCIPLANHFTKQNNKIIYDLITRLYAST